MAETTAVGQVYMGAVDYVMMGLMLLVSMGIGVFFAISGRNNSTKDEYFLGGRRLRTLPVCLSLFATFASAISLLGIPAEVYTYGTMVVYSQVGIVIAYLIGTVTIVPLVHPLKVTSVYEYLEMRFQMRSVRKLGTLIGAVSNVSYMTIALLTPAIALQTAVRLPLWMSIVLIGSVGTAYTAIGGIKSVVWTDVFQTVVIFGGIIVVLIKVCLDVGGMGIVLEMASDNGRIITDDIALDPRVRHTVWSLLVGGFLNHLGLLYSQSTVQRIVSIGSEEHARGTFVLAMIINAVYGVIMVFTGLVLLAYFFTIGCDPVEAGHIKNRNQLMPYFVIHSMSFLPGLPGLYMASIFSASLSTLSSGINSLTANTVEDFLGGFLANKQESTVTAISKAIVCAYGGGIIGLAYLARAMSGPATQLVYIALGATSGPMIGLFFLAATFPQANAAGTVFGLIAGLIASVWISIGSLLYGTLTPPLPNGPVDKCAFQNVSATIDSWNSSWIDDITQVQTTVSNTTAYIVTTTAKSTSIGRVLPDDFSLYDLSYLWTPLIGLLVTVLSGLIASLVVGKLCNLKQHSNPRLFFPFVRRFINSEMVDKKITLLSDFKSNPEIKR
ncbi:hypothetical protein BsWGS_00820 [Bradybaena similaris]